MTYFAMESAIKGLSIALDAVEGEHTAEAKDLHKSIKDLLYFVRLLQLDHEWQEKYRPELTEVEQAGAEFFSILTTYPKCREYLLKLLLGDIWLPANIRFGKIIYR